jgi:hypothetical protein
MIGLGSVRVAVPVAAQSDGCACSDATCDVTVPLCAGQTMDVGSVQAQVINTEDGLVLEVRYDLDEGYELDETHLYVGKTCPEELSSAPGQFPFSEMYSSGVSGDRYLIGFDDICEYEIKGRGGNGRGRGRGNSGNANGGKWEKTGSCGFNLGDCVYVAAHAVVVQRNGDGDVTWEETAWGDGCDGTEFAPGGNWATYFSYTSSFCDVFPKTIFVGYEDLPEGEGNDYDYNDFLVRLNTDFGVQQVGDDFVVDWIEFDITPRAHGGARNHEFNLLFPQGVLCDGTYDLRVYDSGGVVRDSVGQSFETSTGDVDVFLFETNDALPPKTNNDPNVACMTPNRTAVLRIDFNSPCTFDIASLEPTQPHGSGLFFDPYINVFEPGTTVIEHSIGAGDVRLLTVPDTWLWPIEKVPIWDAYTEVDDNGGLPEFTTTTWFDGGYDVTQVYSNCS